MHSNIEMQRSTMQNHNYFCTSLITCKIFLPLNSLSIPTVVGCHFFLKNYDCRTLVILSTVGNKCINFLSSPTDMQM